MCGLCESSKEMHTLIVIYEREIAGVGAETNAETFHYSLNHVLH